MCLLNFIFVIIAFRMCDIFLLCFLVSVTWLSQRICIFYTLEVIFLLRFNFYCFNQYNLIYCKVFHHVLMHTWALISKKYCWYWHSGPVTTNAFIMSDEFGTAMALVIVKPDIIGLLVITALDVICFSWEDMPYL